MNKVLEPQSESASVIAEAAPNADVRWKNGLEWTAVLWLGFLHLGVLAAPFCFTWKGLGVAFVLSWVTASLGVCLGFHRLLTHTGFETFRPIRMLLTLFGTLAGEGPPIMWVSAHRKHHRFSDQDWIHIPRATGRGGATCCGCCRAAVVRRSGLKSIGPMLPIC